MPAPVLVAHDDKATRDLAVATLSAAGIDTVGFEDPIAAWEAIEITSLVRVLVTRVDFGQSLILVATIALALVNWAMVVRRGSAD